MDIFVIFGAKYLYIASAVIFCITFLKVERVRRKEVFALILISLALALVVSMLVREIYFNPRPFVVGDFEPLIPHAPDNGFPSDHTLLASALAAAAMFFSRRTSILLWIIAVLIGLSRVYAGVHHLLDIVASMAIAFGCVILVRTIWKQRKQPTDI